MKKIVFILLFFFVFSCSQKQQNIYLIKGDDVGYFIFEDLIKIYNEDHKSNFVFVGGGAQTALHSFLDGTTNIIFILKELNNEDLALLKSKDIYPDIYPLVKVPLVVIAHIDLPMNRINLIQLKAIISGGHLYWWQVDRKEYQKLNPFGEIDFCNVDARNGEYYFLKNFYQLNDYHTGTRYFNHHSALLDYIIRNRSAIGAISLPFYNRPDKAKILYSDANFEMRGYLVVNNKLQDNQDVKDFIYQLKSFLYKNQYILLKKGIKIIPPGNE